MSAWVVIIIGLAVAAYAALFGVVSWEITFAVVGIGLVLALARVVMLVRARRRMI